MPMTPLPTPPSRDDPANFSARGDAFLGALPAFQTELDAVAAAADADAAAASAANSGAQSAKTAAEAAQAAALASAQASAASAGAAAWVSGSTYAVGAVVWSPASGLIYRRRVAGAGTTDPSADPTNWQLAASALGQMVVVTAATHAAAVGQRVVLTGAVQQTVTAPPAPQPGDTWHIKVASGRTDAVINWGTAKHEGLADATTTLDLAGWSATWVYVNSSYGWGIV